MTVAVTSNKVTFVGNGSTTVFAIPFEFTANSQIVVYVRDRSVSPPTETLQVIVTDYTISGSNLTTVATLTSDDDLLIRRDAAQSQTTDYINTGPFPAETHETALDKVTFLTQQLDEVNTRSLVLPNTMPSTFDPAYPEPQANKFLRVNAGITAFELLTAAEIVTNSIVKAGQEALGNGVSTVTVTFSAALTISTYSISASIKNTADSDPLFLSYVVTAQSTAGFTVIFNDSTDTGDYIFQWTALEQSQ